METSYKIPVHYSCGQYHYSDLAEIQEKSLELYYDDEYKMIFYELPNVKNKEQYMDYMLNVSIYNIESDFLLSLCIIYNENNVLKKITLNDSLIFISYDNEADEEGCLLAAGKENADLICSAISQKTEPIRKLFIEYFYDSEAFDFAVKPCTEKDIQMAEERYGSAKYSGDVPVELRIVCDIQTLKMMLRCCDPGRRDKHYRTLIDNMIQQIKAFADKSLNKTADFELIAEDYD